MLIYHHQVAWEDFRILESESNKLTLELKESLRFKRHKPTLNRNQLSLELPLSSSAILNNFNSCHFSLHLFILQNIKL